ncbi:MAG: hypothetical protein LBR38_02895 [Synergistaceae bacterium]|nr:hypothetical protein [Synergistaceae bacterium]
MSRDPVFLEQEMRKLNFDSEGGAHHVDMLARINLLGGEEPVVFCHIEIQGKGGGDLPTRMYAYRSEIYLKLKVDPIGIVALTDKRPEGEKTFYIWKQFGVVSFYKYLTVSILDLPDEVLLANDSHIGLVLYALKCAKKSGNDEGMKFRYLKELSKMWLERKWEPKDKADILLALDYQMRLRDPDYRRQMVEYMSELTEAAGEEERHMYVSMFEEVYSAQGRAEGMAQGMEKGMARGMARGRTEGRAEVARSMLADGLPPETVRKYTGFTKSEIARLKKADA